MVYYDFTMVLVWFPDIMLFGFLWLFWNPPTHFSQNFLVFRAICFRVPKEVLQKKGPRWLGFARVGKNEKTPKRYPQFRCGFETPFLVHALNFVAGTGKNGGEPNNNSGWCFARSPLAKEMPYPSIQNRIARSLWGKECEDGGWSRRAETLFLKNSFAARVVDDLCFYHILVNLFRQHFFL